MDLNAIEKIEQAISTLTMDELHELYGWLDRHRPPPLDARFHGDLQSGRLDVAIEAALRDDAAGRVRAV